MHEPVRFTITLGLGTLEPFPAGTGFSVRPAREGGYSMREVPLEGGFAGISDSGELVHLQAHAPELSAQPLTLSGVVDVHEPITASIGFGEVVTCAMSVDEDRDVVPHYVRFGRRDPDRLLRLPSGLVVGLAGGDLSMFVYETGCDDRSIDESVSVRRAGICKRTVGLLTCRAVR